MVELTASTLLPHRGQHGGFPAESGRAWLKAFDPACVTRDLTAVYSYAEGLGVQSFGMLGFCWGAWVVAQAADRHGRLKAGGWCHPSVQVGEVLGTSPGPLDLLRGVAVPIFSAVAGNDPEWLQAEGEGHAILASGAGVEHHSFPAMKHGWVLRSDLSDAANREGTEEAVRKAAAFFQARL